MDTENATTCRVPFHDSMPSFMNFRQVLDLLEFKNQASQYFAGNQWCPGVWNPFPFLAWDLSMHPRTQIRFFNQFICATACACSSNYAHKMHINWLKKQICVLGCMLRSHSRNGNEFQTPGQKIEMPGF